MTTQEMRANRPAPGQDRFFIPRWCVRPCRAPSSRVRHPNIVPVHDIGQEGNIHFFAMDFVDGNPLGHAAWERHCASHEFT